MKVFFSAGEASGDVHAAAVAAALRTLRPDCKLYGMGGEHMRRAGVEIIRDIADLGVIGVAEVLANLPRFFRLRSELVQWLREERPDVLVCVDYPGFNMRLAHAAKELGIPVVYYIAPTIWAWHRSRGYAIARDTVAVACIFPMEEAAYREMGANAEFVGHPLLDTVRPTRTPAEAAAYFGAVPQEKQLLLLPGSRRQEVHGLLPQMLRAAEELAQDYPLHCYLPRAGTISRAELEELLAGVSVPVTITEDGLYNLMQICDAAIAASGTVTLEAALMRLPTVLVYRVNPLTYWLGRRLVRLSHIGLPNIVAAKEVIPELLQGEVTAPRIAAPIRRWWEDPAAAAQVRAELAGIRERLGGPGAVRRVARLIERVAEGVDHG